MNLRTNLVLFLVLLLLGGWYYFYEIRGEPERVLQEIEAKRLFPGIDPGTVQRLAFHRIVTMDGDELDRKSFIFTGSGNEWQIEEPVQTKGDTARIKELISRVVTIQTQTIIDESPVDLVPYGLDSPAFKVSFTAGDTVHELVLGNENPTRDYFYARVDSQPAVILVPDTVKFELTRDLFQYRFRRMLDVDSRKIRRMEYTVNEHEPFSLELDGDSWWLTAPGRAPADTSRISDMVNFLEVQEVTEFVDESCDSLEQYGLAAPSLTITAWLDDDRNQVSIEVGDHSDPGGKFRYARETGSKKVFTVTQEFADKYPPDFFYLRSKTVCDFDRSDITRYRLACNNTVFELTRNAESQWQLQKPRKIPTDSGAAGTLLSDLAYLRGMGLKPAETDFGETFIRIELFARDSETAGYTADIGGVPEDGVGRWIRFSEDDTVFKIPDSDVDRFLKSEFDFRNKIILDLDRETIRRISIEKDGKTLTFHSSGETFELPDDSGVEMDAAALDELYWSMSRMVISGITEEYMTPDAVELSKYGLDHPRVILKVVTNKGALDPVRIGNNAENSQQVYVMREMGTVVGLMDGVRVKHFLDLTW